MKFNIYLFDLDGTLLNLGNIGAYANKILEKTLIELKTPIIPNKNERRKFWASGDKFFEVLNKWGVSKPYKFWKSYDKIDFQHRKKLLKNNKIFLFNDVIRVLEEIYNHKDGKKIAIVTNTADYVVDYILKKFNITLYFQEIFSMGFKNDQKNAKPSPNGILSILNKFDYDQNMDKALMVGDSFSDIIAAKKANISACLIKRYEIGHVKGTLQRKYQPDYIIESLDEILKL